MVLAGISALHDNSDNNNSQSAAAATTTVAIGAHHASGLPVTMAKLPPLTPTTPNRVSGQQLPPVANAAAASTRTATANSSSGNNGISNSNSGVGFEVRPPPPLGNKNVGGATTGGGLRPGVRGNYGGGNNQTPPSSQPPSPERQQEQDEQLDEATAVAAASTTEARLRRGSRRGSTSSAATSSSRSASDCDEHQQQQRSASAAAAAPPTTTMLHLEQQQQRFKQLILQLDSPQFTNRARAAAEILSMLQFASGESSNAENDKLRTKALETALELFRGVAETTSQEEEQAAGDQQQQQQQPPSWIAARDAGLIDTALRFAESRPLGTVDCTVALSCVKAAAEIPDCLGRIFTGGAIRVLKTSVLDVVAAKAAANQNNSNTNSVIVNPIVMLSVSLALQTLSFLSETFSAQIVRAGVCEPCVDLAPLVENDDRAAGALCSLAAKLTAAAAATASDQSGGGAVGSAIQQWRELRHGVFAQRLARCILKRWQRARDGTAKVTGCTLVARGLLAIAMLIADGATPLDVVAADASFLSALCEEFDEIANQMDPNSADENEELVNALRVISGISVNSAGGHILSQHPSLKELVSDLLMDLEPGTEDGKQVLLLALVCISNFTFYCFQPTTTNHDDENNNNSNHHQRHPSADSGGGESSSRDSISPACDSVALLWLESLLPSLLGILFSDASSPEALVEATRALGNISRTASGCAACRQHRIDEVVCALLIHADPRIVYNCLGVVTNLSAVAINECTPRSLLPWLTQSEEQVIALAEGKSHFGDYPEVAELANAARCNIAGIQ